MRFLGRMTRRDALAGALVTAGSTLAVGLPTRLDAAPAGKRKVAAFIKFIQSLTYDQMAETIAELGFDGIEATVRKNGYIQPEQAEDELPKLVEALRKHQLEITVMASDVNRADDPVSEKVLRTAAKLGVQRYRMKYYRYDLAQPIMPQLMALQPMVKDLAALNAELGITGVYQNHAGAKMVGCSIWDVHRLFAPYDREALALAFDIRHATVEGGTGWQLDFQLVQDRLGAVYVKDFVWEGRQPKNVPLGQGQVDPKFFQNLARTKSDIPVSLHVEYLGQSGTEENVSALRRDLKTLQQWL